MWMVVGRPPDEACGSGTGAGTLWAGALPGAPGPFLPATRKGCATAASATCQGTIQCRQPAKAKRETTRASWRDQVEGIARKADPSCPFVATFSFLTAATSCASSRLAAPPRVWRWRRSSSSRFVARLVAGAAARGFRAGLAANRCWGVTTASFTPSLVCASRVAGTPLSTAICFFRAGLVAVTDRPARPGDASLATAHSRLAQASRLATNI
mmetsp:Transcript_21636/g.55041  ORF Transcript_21636/g.55041 Transcript_21636/m.55041 type:complete len:212 (-) Transcript_21636:30-665(-)